MARFFSLASLALISTIFSAHAQEEQENPNIDSSWSCSSKDKETSCCNFVPSFFEIYSSVDCADHRPLLSIALGFGDTSLLSSSSTSVSTASQSYCSASLCASRINSLAQQYEAVPLSGRLCGQIKDGLWRVGLICSQDSKNNFCFQTYASITRSFDGRYKNRISPENLCNSTCLRVILDAAVSQSSRIKFAISTSMSDSTKPELENALRRSLALLRFADLICSFDDDGKEFCATRLGLFSRSAGIYSRPLDIDENKDETIISSRRLQQVSDVQSSDSITRLFDPRERPGFSCSHCGRILKSALVDVSESIGLTAITTGSALSVSRMRNFAGIGECGIDKGMTCLEKYVTNVSTTSTTISIHDISNNCKYDLRTKFKNGCSTSCKAALATASEILGCCFKSVLQLRLAESRSMDDMDDENDDSSTSSRLAKNIFDQCKVALPSSCRAESRKFFATTFDNIPFAWASAFPTRLITLSEALFKDFAFITGAPSTVFTMHSAISHNGDTVFITGITSESNATTFQIWSLVKKRTSSESTSSTSFPHLSAAIFVMSASTDFMPSPPTLRASDETDSFAPEDEVLYDIEPTQSASSSTQLTTFSFSSALIVSAAAFIGLFCHW